MKTGMRYLLVIILFFIMGSISAQNGQRQNFQQVQRTPEEVSDAQISWIKTDLKLDEISQKKVYDILLNTNKQVFEERQKMTPGGNHDLMRARMTEIIAARDKELKAFLGNKNYKLFKTKEAERKKAMMKKRENYELSSSY